jgi:type IV secretory pathway protease TraF
VVRVPQVHATICPRPQGVKLATRSTGVMLALLLTTVIGSRFFTLNTEPSVPVGLWQKHAVPAVLTRGLVVIFAPPPPTFPWHPWWIPFLKPVAGIAGDVVCVDEEGFWVRDEWYGPMVATAGGRAVPHLDGCHTVGLGEVAVASHGRRSLDSRYIGMLRQEDMLYTATPVWVWR